MEIKTIEEVMEYLSLGLIIASSVLVILSIRASKKAKELLKQAEELKKRADLNREKIEDLIKYTPGEWIETDIPAKELHKYELINDRLVLK